MKKDLIAGAGWAAAFLALALAARFARELGYVDGDTVTRGISGVVGLYIAWYGNRLPKVFVPSASGRRLRRVAGWSHVLSGLVYSGLWAFAPIPVAAWVGTAVILAGIAVPIGYCVSRQSKAKAAG